jgi:beta-glucosidase/6-phospho-beta-glucosidase/beta-galactosidase
LVYVNYETLERTMKDSGKWFKQELTAEWYDLHFCC